MLVADQLTNSFVYCGLPCIWTGSKYILFDPANLKMCAFDGKEKMASKETEDKLKKIGFGLNPQPLPSLSQEKHVTLILTTDCNLGCPHCYANSKVSTLFMEPATAISILESQIPEKSEVNLQYFGGEPTLNFECLKATYEFAKERFSKLFAYITTNGVMEQTVLDYLIKNRFGFYLSVDGNKQFHDECRFMKNTGEGTFDKVMNTLRQLVDNDIAVKVRATISQKNVKNMVEFSETMFDKGVRLIHFAPLTSVGRGKNFSQETMTAFQDEFVASLEKVFDLARTRGARVMSPATMAIGKSMAPYCKIFFSENKILITPEGKRTLCFGTQDEYNPIANQFICADFDNKTRSFVTRNDNRQLIAEQYQRNLRQCDNCFARYMCQGGCLVENLSLTGNMTTRSELWCLMQKKIWHAAIMRIYTANGGN